MVIKVVRESDKMEFEVIKCLYENLEKEVK